MSSNIFDVTSSILLLLNFHLVYQRFKKIYILEMKRHTLENIVNVCSEIYKIPLLVEAVSELSGNKLGKISEYLAIRL